MDVILLKMTDEIVKVSTDPVSATQVANARKLIELYPKATLVDSLDAQAGTTDRESMHHFFEKLNALPACTRCLSFKLVEGLNFENFDFSIFL